MSASLDSLVMETANPYKNRLYRAVSRYLKKEIFVMLILFSFQALCILDGPFSDISCHKEGVLGGTSQKQGTIPTMPELPGFLFEPSICARDLLHSVRGVDKGEHSQRLGRMEARGCGELLLSLISLTFHEVRWSRELKLTKGEGLHGFDKERGSLFGEPA